MEPANLNQPAPDDAKLEALLRQPLAPLRDDGFTANVLAALPPRAAAPSIWPRRIVCLIGAAFGVGVVLVFGQPWSGWDANWREIETAFRPAGAQLADPTALAALAVAAVSLGFAFWSGIRRRIRFLR